mmetsp:Transcript_11535/g.35281  ORF Transcript_11535/g.35281 Transcript_11535/m.35281 type:complete len:211 (-) Transcript_11535:1952-2584(-)
MYHRGGGGLTRVAVPRRGPGSAAFTARPCGQAGTSTVLREFLCTLCDPSRGGRARSAVGCTLYGAERRPGSPAARSGRRRRADSRPARADDRHASGSGDRRRADSERRRKCAYERLRRAACAGRGRRWLLVSTARCHLSVRGAPGPVDARRVGLSARAITLGVRLLPSAYFVGAAPAQSFAAAAARLWAFDRSCAGLVARASRHPAAFSE